MADEVCEVARSLKCTADSDKLNPLHFSVGDGRTCESADLPDRWKPACAERAKIIELMVELSEDLRKHDPGERTPEQVRDLRIRFQEAGGRLANFDALRRGRVSLAVRGGISVGAYQAGFMYYFSEFMKAHHGQWRRVPDNFSAEQWDLNSPNHEGLLYNFETVTGASAGSINAMITALEGCKKPVPRPTTSNFFRSWIEIGLTGRHGELGLIPHKASSSAGFLSSEPIEEAAKQLVEEAEYNRDVVPGCQLDLGLTVTRINGSEFPVVVDTEDQPLLSVRRARERFAFDLSFETAANRPGARLKVENRRPRAPLRELDFPQPDPATAIETFYLSLGNNGPRVAVGELMAAVVASGAFPIAFAPRKLEFTGWTAQGKVDHSQSGSAFFIDGGIFENKPIGLALDLNDWRTRRRVERLIECTLGLRTDQFARLTAMQRRDLGEIRAELARARSVSEWDNAAKRLAQFQHDENLSFSQDAAPVPACAPGEKAVAAPSTSTSKWSELNDILPKRPRTLLFVEPTVVTWTSPGGKAQRPEAIDGIEKDFFGVVFKFFGTFLGSALQASLMDTVEHRPWLRQQRSDTLTERIVVPKRHLPIAGEMLARFMGFFERDFRVFDFFVGMADAKRFIENDPVFRLSGATVKVEDPRFDCIWAYYDRSSGDVGRHHRKYSRGRLPPECRREALLSSDDRARVDGLSKDLDSWKAEVIANIADDWTSPSYSPARQRDLEAVEHLIAAENFGSMLVAMHEFRRYMVETKTDHRTSSRDFDAFFESLYEASYQFVDTEQVRLEVDPPFVKLRRRSWSSQMKQTVRMAMEAAIERYAAKQPTKAGNAGVSVLFKAAADAYAPYSPRLAVDLGVTFNGIESRLAGYPYRNRFRIDYFVFRFFRIGQATLSHVDGPNGGGNLHGRRHWLSDMDFSALRFGGRLANVKSVLRIEAMLGPVLSLTYNMGSAQGGANGPALFMARLGPQLGIDLLLLRRIYVELTGSYFFGQWQGPGFGDGEGGDLIYYSGSRGAPVDCWTATGIDFTRCAQFTASAGWRWNF